MLKERLTALLDPALATFPLLSVFGFFEDGGGDGGGGDGGGGDGAGNGDGDGGDAGDAGKVFNESQVEKIVRDRLAQERAKYSDYDDLKTKAGELDKIRQEQQSEEERLRETLSSKERAEAALQETVQELRAQIAVEREAVKAGASDLEAVWRLLDHSSLEYDDNGFPTNAQAVVEKLLEDRAYLKGGDGKAPSTTSPAKPSTRTRQGPEPAPGRARMRDAYGRKG